MIVGPDSAKDVYIDPQPQWPWPFADRLNDPVTRFLSAPAIKELRANYPPMTERRACELLLIFANEAQLTANQWAEFMGPRAPTGRVMGGQVRYVRALLKEIVIYREKAFDRFAPYLAEKLNEHGVIALPVMAASSGVVQISYRLVARSILAACDYALCLFADAAKPFGREVWRCQVESCENFFFEYRSSERGKPTRTYCSDACKTQGHRDQIRESVKRHRKAARKHK